VSTGLVAAVQTNGAWSKSRRRDRDIERHRVHEHGHVRLRDLRNDSTSIGSMSIVGKEFVQVHKRLVLWVRERINGSTDGGANSSGRVWLDNFVLRSSAGKPLSTTA